MIQIFIMMLFSCLFAHGHGEDKPGPHGGYIRMPAGFHIEVLHQGPNAFKVYLLDMEWKNPVVKSSSVKATFKDKTQVEGKCAVKTDFFLCSFDKGLSLDDGELIIESTREKQVGNPITFPLPLRSHRPGH